MLNVSAVCKYACVSMILVSELFPRYLEAESASTQATTISGTLTFSRSENISFAQSLKLIDIGPHWTSKASLATCTHTFVDPVFTRTKDTSGMTIGFTTVN